MATNTAAAPAHASATTSATFNDRAKPGIVRNPPDRSRATVRAPACALSGFIQIGGVEEELHGSIPPNNPQCTTGGAANPMPGNGARPSITMERTVPGKTFYIETFGCQMNVHDTEKVAG